MTYTFIDGSGVRTAVAAGGSALSYVLLLFVLDGVPYPALVVLKRDAAGRRAILDYAKRRWPLAALGGAASIGSYAIALWAMTRAPVAAVSALRETSVLFATLARCLAAEGAARRAAAVGGGGDRRRRDRAALRLSPAARATSALRSPRASGYIVDNLQTRA